jgi:hypothetical protein
MAPRSVAQDDDVRRVAVQSTAPELASPIAPKRSIEVRAAASNDEARVDMPWGMLGCELRLKRRQIIRVFRGSQVR